MDTVSNTVVVRHKRVFREEIRKTSCFLWFTRYCYCTVRKYPSRVWLFIGETKSVEFKNVGMVRVFVHATPLVNIVLISRRIFDG